MGRNILFVTTDQMRYDALGCNGGKVARTPAIDKLAAEGVNYRRAHNQNVVCMPARATIMTGQHVATHGVWMNGVSLPEDTPTVAHVLNENGYRTALIGKAHFEPWLGKPEEFYENRMASEGSTGPHRGFDHMELANHFLEGHSHYDHWIREHHPDAINAFYPMIDERGMQNKIGAGGTGAIQVWPAEVDREVYHTDWVATRTISWLDQVAADEPWFAWMSFPDPHHPWDPPQSEMHRHDWRDVPLPELYPKSREQAVEWLSRKPRHWMGYYEGTHWTNLESPHGFRPCDLTEDQIREINALNHIENELIDDACARVFAYLDARGWADNTDVIFTTDHGELQGDYGLLFKGAYHTDALMRLPLIWRPAPSAKVTPAEVTAPVGHLNLASTFCDIAGITTPDWVEGDALPISDADAEENGFERVLTEWSSEHGEIKLDLNTIYRDDWICTQYEAGSLYDGSEGELYNLRDDPGALVNLWDDPKAASIRSDLLADLKDSLPEARSPRLDRKAPV